MTLLRAVWRRLRGAVVDDSTVVLPAVDDWPHDLADDVWWPEEPDPDGWSAQRGWHYAEKWEWCRAGWDPRPAGTPMFDDLGGEHVLYGRRPQLAIEPAPTRELEGATR